MLFKLTEKPLQMLILVFHISFLRLHVHSAPSLLLFPSAFLKDSVQGIQAGFKFNSALKLMLST